jgi:hypothetical protein
VVWAKTQPLRAEAAPLWTGAFLLVFPQTDRLFFLLTDEGADPYLAAALFVAVDYLLIVLVFSGSADLVGARFFGVVVVVIDVAYSLQLIGEFGGTEAAYERRELIFALVFIAYIYLVLRRLFRGQADARVLAAPLLCGIAAAFLAVTVPELLSSARLFPLMNDAEDSTFYELAAEVIPALLVALMIEGRLFDVSGTAKTQS